MRVGVDLFYIPIFLCYSKITVFKSQTNNPDLKILAPYIAYRILATFFKALLYTS